MTTANTTVRPQRTIKTSVEFEGVGIHTGAPVKVRLEPAPANSGVVFFRSDIEGSGEIPAHVEYRSNQPRRTALSDKEGKAEVHTVEHLLSAVHALGVDNLVVHMSGPEAPGLDGSAKNFLEHLESAGIEDQDSTVETLVLKQPVAVTHKGASVCAIPTDEPGLTLCYTLHYPVKTIGAQYLEVKLSEESFKEQISKARTFCLEVEAMALRAAGLGQGATTENTVIYGEKGVIDTTLRYDDEAVRHKVLDLIGDLALLGRPLQARIVAVKSGHDLNAQLVEQILATHS